MLPILINIVYVNVHHEKETRTAEGQVFRPPDRPILPALAQIFTSLGRLRCNRTL